MSYSSLKTRGDYKNFLVILIIVAGLVWGGDKWYFNYRQYHNRPESHEIQGQLKSVSQSGLDIVGFHVLDNYPQNSDVAHPQPLLVEIATNTKFVKTIWYMPTKAELAKTNGVWYPDKLKKDEQAGSVKDFDLVQGILLTIKTPNNSIGDRIIKASEIDYVIRVYP